MVRFGFFQKSEKFFAMLSEAARNVHQGARALQEMLQDFRGIQEHWRAVEEYEHEGDKITHRIVQTLYQSRMGAADRDDIHRLTSTLDDVLDLVEGSAARMVMYKVAKPTPEAQQLAGVIIRSTDQIVQGIGALPDYARIQPHCIEINRLENEADEIARGAIANLFVGQPAPIEVIKWKEIYETMELATDKCEDVADSLEQIVLKQA